MPRLKLPKDQQSFNRKIAEEFKLPEHVNRQLIDIAKQMVKIELPKFNLILPDLSKTLENTRLAALKATQSLISSRLQEELQKISSVTSDFLKHIDRHFPENWSRDKYSQANKLCLEGLPVIFVPRAEIVDKMISANGVRGVKITVTKHSPEILEDCTNAIMESTWLSKDMREHLLESIASYRVGNFRAAQSTAIIGFDSLLNEVVDMKSWRRKTKRGGRLSHSAVSKYSDVGNFDLMRLPLGKIPFYTILMFPMLNRMLTSFELGNTKTYSNDVNRHATTHTVSSKQYKKSNALLAIMSVASICKVTQLQGKNWVEKSFDSYGFTL